MKKIAIIGLLSISLTTIVYGNESTPSLGSPGSIATSIVCTITQKQAGGSWKEIDRLTVGQDGGSYITELGRPIENTDGLGIHIDLANDSGRLTVQVMKPSSGWDYRTPNPLFAYASANTNAGLQVIAPAVDLMISCNNSN